MRWKYLKIALIGAVLDLFGQMLADFFIPSIGFEPAKPGEKKALSVFQLLCVLHEDEDETRPYNETFMSKADPLLYQAVALCWIARRSDGAFRTAAISALLLVAIVQSIEHLKRNKLMANNS